MGGQKVMENGSDAPVKSTRIGQKKTAAKAAGLKSTFILDADHGELLMTSFGRGSEANLEKRIHGSVIADLRGDQQQFQVVQKRVSDYELKSSRLTGLQIITGNPSHSSGREHYLTPGMDQLRRKPMLERRYFGKEFQDNIHIQMIYNILDINKILAVYSSSVVYILNNVCRADSDTMGDLIGSLSTGYTYKDSKATEKTDAISFRDFIKREQLKYFGTAFHKIDSLKQRSSRDYCKQKDEDEIYNILALLGSLRQFCTHGAVQLGDGKETHAWLYDLSSIDASFLHTLNKTYADAIRTVNHEFAKTNKVNLRILMDALDIADKDLEWFARDYYEFIVLKPQKNLGLSLKKLRECLLELPQGQKLKEQKYDSVRHKLNTMLDYMLYYYYTQIGPDRLDELVATLRAQLISGESEEKDGVYQQEAQRLWPECEPVISYIVRCVDGKEIRRLQKEPSFDERVFDPVKLSALTPDSAGSKAKQNADYFCELMYLLTLFLDGKEINDLLTTLISKFDNIASFYSVLGAQKMERYFAAECAMFTQSAAIAQTLRAINSFARMQKPTPNAGRVMYRDAIQLLGTDMTEDQVEAAIMDIFGFDGDSGEKRTGAAHDVRNFIANNVIESDRFRYLIRYSDPRKVRRLAENRHIVRFVLSEIPDTQLTRYCVSCGRKDLTRRGGQIDFLAKLIVHMNYQQFVCVKNDDRKSTRKEKEEKQRFSAIISLYLTVLYLAVKNLVYVNARYVMAFHCWERDTALYREELPLEKSAGKRQTDYLRLTNYFIGRKWLKKRPCAYLKEDCAHADNRAIRLYRNQVAHLNAVRDVQDYASDIKGFSSYFQLYHYAMQRAVQKAIRPDLKNSGVSPRTADYFAALDKYRTYSKDFTKALNAPFGYNLARFKNLSVDELFDRNRPK